MNTPASNQTSSARFEPLKAVWHQFLKDSDKLPGWVPLYVVTMAAIRLVFCDGTFVGSACSAPKLPRSIVSS